MAGLKKQDAMPAFTLSSLLESRATRVAGLALAYWLTVVLAIELVTPVEKIALFWPPNAIVAAVLLFTPRRDWLMYLAAMAVAYFAGRLPGGQLPVVVYVVFCVANFVEVLMVAEAVKRFVPSPVTHATLPRVLPVAMLALIPATLVSATMAGLIVDAEVEPAQFWMAWIGWLTSDLAGMLLVLPVLLAWVAPGAPPIAAYTRDQMIERTVVGVLLAAIGLAIPTVLGDQQQISLVFPYLVFPILVWTAMRTGIRSTTLITLVVGLYSVFLTFLGQGPYAFKGLSAFGQVVVMKGGLITITVTTIFLSVLVTGRKQVEVALETSRRTLRSVIDAVPAMINAKDQHSRYVFMNRYQASLYGVEPEAAVGRTAAELVGADYGAYTGAIDAEVLRTNTPKINFEETWVGPNARLFTLLTTKVPLRDETGAAALVVTVSLDISERKMAEEERRRALEKAEEASRAKSEFLATISHELRTPLNAILGFADILSHQYMGPLGQDKYVEYAGDIHASGKYLLDLVNDILDISTIEAGKKSLYKEELSVGEAVDECIKAVAGHARERRIKVSAEVPGNLPRLYADRRAIKQILLNLLTNAVKFTPAGGKVALTASASARDTVITIADTGVGIEEGHIATLVKPFERGRIDPYVSRGGVGLGLAITRSLVELHDGTLAITSQPGKGTTVTVRLPNDNV